MISGRVWTDAAWMRRNANCNFWRTVENLTIEPPGASNMWAVSQAAPMRRTHIKGDLYLSSGGWSSGGFLADCRIDGKVIAGSQQQWFSRNSEWNEWNGVNWNMVFLGCRNVPPGEWPKKAVTAIETAPLKCEKPYLLFEGASWFVKVPPFGNKLSSGVTWGQGETPGDALPIEKFHIAKAGTDTARSINAALGAGKHLLLTPGIYLLEDTVVVTRPGTVVFGLGLPSLVPASGKTALGVEAVEGVRLSGLVFVTIHAGHVLGDNFWLWRADHGAGVGWDQNLCDTGLQVEGSDVTIYGLFVEHTQKHQVVWNGERGRVYFYQSEMPYDPPSQDAWRSPGGDGWASYTVGEAVSTHEAWGLGVYHVFKRAAAVAENAFETPSRPGIKIHHAFTYRLYGGKPGSGIRNVLDGTGGELITSTKASVLPAGSAEPPGSPARLDACLGACRA